MIRLLSKNDFESKLGKLLEAEHNIAKNVYKDAVKEAEESNRHISQVLFDNQIISPTALLKALSALYDVPPVSLKRKTIVPYVLNMIPKEVAEEHSIILFKKSGTVIHVATTDPENNQTLTFIAKQTGLTPKVYITSHDEIERALRRYQQEITTEFSQILSNAVRETRSLDEPADRMAYNVPIIKMVNAILEHALSQKASDIHVEPTAEEVVIRFRIDGLLKKTVTLPRDILLPIITRIKIMAQLKIDEHRMPQDGRFKYTFQDRDVAIRTSVIPVLHGPKVVLRLLDMKERDFTLSRLGLNGKHLKMLRDEISKPQGMILVTGPTGSGKTTTLYALLRMLNREDINISTIEDPIEYGIEGINQTQINTPAGLTFAHGLRSLLRQDPNVLMVGEIRDTETATICMNAAMTGHLVLSTLHTNSAFQAIPRLVEMGIKPFMAASVANIIISQRLVRTICPDCRMRQPSTPKILEQYQDAISIEKTIAKLSAADIITETDPRKLNFYRGQGCEKCHHSGYRGRQGIYEIVQIDQQLYDEIVKTPSADTIYRHAMKNGELTLLEDGLLKVIQGVTTFDEVLRVTKE